MNRHEHGVPSEHNSKIKEIFHRALSEDIWVSIDEFNEDIDQLSELETPYKAAKLNILTQSMLDYDRAYFSESSVGKPIDYRPYFFSYIIYMDPRSDREAYGTLRNMGDKWFIARFSKKAGWHEYQGEIESSASPVIYREHKIYISDAALDSEIVDQINLAYNIVGTSSDQDIKKQLISLLQNVQFKSSRIYKVGNGNLINITGCQGTQEFNMVYDAGYHSRQYPNDKRRAYGGAVNSFKTVIPNVVFLSHWDDDHIMGCVYARSELFDCPWIAPEIVKTKAISARRLASYLTVRNKLTIVARDKNARLLAKICTSNSTISFYLGENKSKQTITKENCGGMVIEITTHANGNTIESLFCGDVPYEAVKTVIWNRRTTGYDYLLVPHHGSNMDYTSLVAKHPATAVVCGNGSSNRPLAAHKNALTGKGYHVKVTQNATKHPWIELRFM